jgi:hypothetical protein
MLTSFHPLMAGPEPAIQRISQKKAGWRRQAPHEGKEIVLCSYRSPEPIACRYLKSTTVPLLTIFASARASQLVRRTQPCEEVLPMAAGSGVP